MSTTKKMVSNQLMFHRTIGELRDHGPTSFTRACWFMLCSKLGVKSFEFPLFGSPFYVRSNPKKLGVDGTFYSRRERYERELQNWFRLPQAGGTFIDIGANYGFWSRFVVFDSTSRRLPDVKIIAFEPLPSNFQQLARNIEAVRSASLRVACEQLALGDCDSVVHMNLSNDDPGSTFVGSSGGVQVPLTSLDKYVQTHSVERIAIIKMDVEGFEPAVLRGARQTLARDRPLVICEVVKHHLARHGFIYADMFSEFSQLGYSAHQIMLDGSLKPMCHDPSDGNYVFRPV